MTHQIITDGLHGTITVLNEKYNYNGEEYLGAKFIITLPIG